ncbi:MAG: hypothetical protein SangKO_001590 [Sandaracinaceae bacterium]
MTRAVRSRSPRWTSPSAKRFAARIGPTVWELEGPIPIVNMSKTLMAMGVAEHSAGQARKP